MMPQIGYGDDVRGEVIGPILHKCELVAPNGRIQSESHAKTMQDAKTWGDGVKQRMLNVVCGNGLPLYKNQVVMESIFGKGEWRVNFYG